MSILMSANEAAKISLNNLSDEVKEELRRINNIIKLRAEEGYITVSVETPRQYREIICKELKEAGYSYNYVDILENIDIKW